MASAAKLATYADLVALPEGVKAEFLGSELVIQPRQTLNHAHVRSGLNHFLGGPFEFAEDGPGGRDIVGIDHKFQLYARHGVPHDSLVNPDVRLLEAYALDGGQWKNIGVDDETASARIAPFEAIELPVGRLFLPEPPPASP